MDAKAFAEIHCVMMVFVNVQFMTTADERAGGELFIEEDLSIATV